MADRPEGSPDVAWFRAGCTRTAVAAAVAVVGIASVTARAPASASVGDAPSSAVPGFVFSRGRFAAFEAAEPGAEIFPTGVNDRGHVLGHYVDSDGTTHGFLWRDGRFTTLDVPGATSPTPVDINDRGQIVGYPADNPDLEVARAFLLMNGLEGPATPINFPGAPKSVALGINDRGDIVGLYEAPANPPNTAATDEQRPGALADVDLVTVRDITVSVVIAGQVEGLLTAAEADGSTSPGAATGTPRARSPSGAPTVGPATTPSTRCPPTCAHRRPPVPACRCTNRGLAIDF